MHGNVTIKDLLFFADDTTSASQPTLATYGFDSGYLCYARKYLHDEWNIEVVQPSETYISNDLFAKQMLPKCKEARTDSLDSQNITTIHGGGGISFDVAMHNPLTGNARFVKPLINYYANENQKTYTNFTWLPFRSPWFLEEGRPIRAQNVYTQDNKYWCNYDGHTVLGKPGPEDEFHNLPGEKTEIYRIVTNALRNRCAPPRH